MTSYYIDDPSPISGQRQMDSSRNIYGDNTTNLLYPLSASTRAFINLSFTTQSDPLFPAETAYDRLLSLLQSQFPWKVTPVLLFCICRILEESRPSAAPDPSHRTLLPVLRKMRTWRLMERRSLEGLASDLAGLVDLELSAPYDTLEANATHKPYKGNDEAEDKENAPAIDKVSHLQVRAKPSKRSRHTTSLNDLFGDPVPAFRRHCAACEALRTAGSKSSATFQNIHRTLQHTHDNDGLAFPRPPPPTSSFSGSKSRTSLLPRNEKSVDVGSEAFEPVTPGPRRALAAMNGGSRSNSQNTNVSISPPSFWAEDGADFNLNEVWIKRRSQEEGWRP